ncbi:MAG: IPT/TIG domain-containing protein [Planctomycetales bacterium]|nr:IPT/TIG domain-containing protein [Planctomycetales bacterium]
MRTTFAIAAGILAGVLSLGCRDRRSRGGAETPPPGPPPAPTLTSIAPVSGPTAGGTSVTLAGTGFQSGATIAIGGSAATSVVVVSATSITAATPSGSAGPANVTVTNPDSQSATIANGFTYTSGAAPAPTVTAVSPASGPVAGGTLITVSGTGFQTGAAVSIGFNPATSVTVLSAGTLTCVTPPGSAGATFVMVVNPDSQAGSLSNGFTYLGPPTISSVTPASGPPAGGQTVTIAGAGFQPGATVLFGGNAATSVTVASTTSLACVTPAGAVGTVAVRVTNPDGQWGSLAAAYSYLAPAPPTLSSLAPTSGPTAGGQSVTLTGSDFLGGAAVTFGPNPATGVVVLSSTQITCVTPVGVAGSVNVTVANPDLQSSTLTSAYTYSAAPAPAAVSPSSGDTAGGTPVTVTGTGFGTGATVLFGTSLAGSVVVLSPTALTCVTPSGTTGAVNVTVTNPGGASGTLTNGFTYTSGGSTPSVTAVSPGSGPSSGGTLVTITGSNFQTGAAVTVGGAAATSVTFVNSSTLTAVTPRAPSGSGATAAVPVTVTNPGAGSATLASAFLFLPGAVESVSDTASHPDVAVDGSGRVHVVWRRTASGGATDILHVRSTDGGRTWSATPLGLEGSSNVVSRPRVAARGNTVLAVWNETISGAFHVAHAYSTDGGATWSSGASLLNNGGVLPDPDAGLDGNGNAVVAFTVYGGIAPQGGSYVRIATIHGTPGSAFTSPVQIGGAMAGPPSVAADGNGIVVVAWDNFPVSGGPVMSNQGRDVWTNRSTDGGGTWGTAQNVTNTGTTLDSNAPAVALSGSAAVLAWESNPTSGASVTYTVYAAGSTDGGATWNAAANVSGSTSPIKDNPAVAVDGSGSFTVAWEEFVGGGSFEEVLSSRTTDVAQTFSTPVNLSGTASGPSIRPAVAGGAGTFTIHVWAEDPTNSGTFDVVSY